MTQETFDLAIGRLDYALSVMLLASKDKDILPENAKTLIHHAEDMMGAAGKILEKLVSAEVCKRLEQAVAATAINGMAKAIRETLNPQGAATQEAPKSPPAEPVWKEETGR